MKFSIIAYNGIFSLDPNAKSLVVLDDTYYRIEYI